MNDDTKSAHEKSVKDEFDAARNQASQDFYRASDAARDEIEKIHAAAERQRETLREDQAKTRDSDIVEEKKRLLLLHAKPELTPSGFLNMPKAKPIGNDALEQKATRAIDQRYEREYRATYVREDTLVNDAVERDKGRTEGARDAGTQDHQQAPSPAQAPAREPVSTLSLKPSQHQDMGAAFSRAANNPERER